MRNSNNDSNGSGNDDMNNNYNLHTMNNDYYSNYSNANRSTNFNDTDNKSGNNKNSNNNDIDNLIIRIIVIIKRQQQPIESIIVVKDTINSIDNFNNNNYKSNHFIFLIFRSFISSLVTLRFTHEIIFPVTADLKLLHVEASRASYVWNRISRGSGIQVDSFWCKTG